jgi:protoporphyrinogen oxidase
MRQWFWATVSMTIFSVPLEQCSAGALLHFYQQLIGHRGVQFGFPKAALADLFVPQAVRAIEAAHGSIVLNRPVTAIDRHDSAVAGVELKDGEKVRSDWVICALPPQDAARLLPFSEDFAAFRPSPYVSVYLWFAAKITSRAFWTQTWSPRTLIYDSYDLSNIRTGWQQRGAVVASNIIYSHRAHSMADDEIVRRVRAELVEFAPAAATTPLLHSVVNRIPMAIPCPAPGTENKRPGPLTATRGLLLAGDWTATGLPATMESAACSGMRAAEVLLAQKGKEVHLAQPVRPLQGLVALANSVSRVRARQAL